MANTLIFMCSYIFLYICLYYHVYSQNMYHQLYKKQDHIANHYSHLDNYNCNDFIISTSLQTHNSTISHFIYSNDSANGIMIYHNPNMSSNVDINIKNFLSIYLLYDEIISQLSTNNTINTLVYIKLNYINDTLYHDCIDLHHFLINKYIKPYYLISNFSFTFIYQNNKYIDTCVSINSTSLLPYSLINYTNSIAVPIPVIESKYIGRSNSLVVKCFKYVNTRKYSSDCMPAPKILRQVLVTGLGGSGTHTLTNLLRSMEIDVIHERMYLDGSVCWMYSVNDKLGRIKYPYLSELKNSYNNSIWSPRFERVIHIIRCPLKQISSMTSHSIESSIFQSHFINMMSQVYHSDILTTRSDILRLNLPYCKKYNLTCLHVKSAVWLYWNQMIQSYADVTYRIEDVTDVIADTCYHFIYTTNLIKKRGSLDKCMIYLNLTLNERKVYTTSDLNSIKLSLKLRSNLTNGYAKNMNFWERYYTDSSPGHHVHAKYTISDIQSIDMPLANMIQLYSKQLNYSNDLNCE